MSHKHARGKHKALPPMWCGGCQKRTWLDKCFECGAATVRRIAK